MDSLPPLELLQATHTFPCRFLFKIIGKDEDEFHQRVLTAVADLPDLSGEPESSVRRTPNGRHIAVSLEMEVAAAEHILQIYEQLRRLEGLVMLM